MTISKVTSRAYLLYVSVSLSIFFPKVLVDSVLSCGILVLWTFYRKCVKSIYSKMLIMLTVDCPPSELMLTYQ